MIAILLMLPPPRPVVSSPTSLDVAPTLFSSAAIAIATMDPTAATPSIASAAIDIIATAGAVAMGSSKGPHDKTQNGECSLLGPFALVVQAALGGLALMALVYKRWKERPQRPLKVWMFDVSKQIVGSVLVHIANLLMSLLSSGQLSIAVDPSTVQSRDVDKNGKYQPNPCSFYLLNLAIDTTVGIPILIVLLRVLTMLFVITPVGNPPESIQSGNYGTPPRAWWWAKQSMIYFMGLMGMKICVLIIFILLPWISQVGDWALRWTEGNEQLQVFFVMLFFPVIMNATQYYIIDSFIKNQKPEHEPLAGDEDDYDGATGERNFVEESGSSDEINSGDEEDIPRDFEVKAKAKVNVRSTPGLKDIHEYDPQYDGDSTPTVVGSSSSSNRIPLVSQETDSEFEATKSVR